MLGKLKSGMGGKAQAMIEGLLDGQLQKLTALSPEVVRDDESFRAKFVTPAVLAIAAASGGASALAPRFNQRTEKTLFRLRDELVIEKDGQLALADNYRERLPGVVKAGFAE